jgi:hypothetical protein
MPALLSDPMTVMNRPYIGFQQLGVVHNRLGDHRMQVKQSLIVTITTKLSHTMSIVALRSENVVSACPNPRVARPAAQSL